VVIVETVGVGQSESTVASMVDFFLLLLLTGAGDELQGIKKGVLELADAIAVNKADGQNIEKAKEARKIYENALHLLTPTSPHWHPPVLTCSGLTMEGIPEIWGTVMAHRKKMIETEALQINRKKQNIEWMWALVEEQLKLRFFQNERVKNRLPGIIQSVEQDKMGPTKAAFYLLSLLDMQSNQRMISNGTYSR
jgi:LAO/AO transport system kinase